MGWWYTTLTYSFPNLELVHCFTSGINCCFLTCTWFSQEVGKVVWYSHLLKNFPQFAVIHTVKDFSVVNEAEVDVFFWNPFAFSMFQQMLAIWSLVLLLFLNPAWMSGSSWFMYFWNLVWRILSITLIACEISSTGFGKKTDLFESCCHCWIFQIKIHDLLKSSN